MDLVTSRNQNIIKIHSYLATSKYFGSPQLMTTSGHGLEIWCGDSLTMITSSLGAEI